MLDIKRLRELVEAATQGRWYVDGEGVYSVVWDICENGWEYDECSPEELTQKKAQDESNRQAIAALRNAAPELIALAEWAEKAKEALQFIGCKKDQYRGYSTDCGPYVGLCDRCDLLKSYPGGQQ